ncbi:hypothetical protein [Pelosinus baikalensis]|uniref:hypothetical protein n=1 Tax=Pelosinus baikalensis TaxID=2892015 RepID=UPI001E2CF067|nr:hypothetical protein [Pelosinus baikalensis]
MLFQERRGDKNRLKCESCGKKSREKATAEYKSVSGSRDYHKKMFLWHLHGHMILRIIVSARIYNIPVKITFDFRGDSIKRS